MFRRHCHINYDNCCSGSFPEIQQYWVKPVSSDISSIFLLQEIWSPNHPVRNQSKTGQSVGREVTIVPGSTDRDHDHLGAFSLSLTLHLSLCTKAPRWNIKADELNGLWKMFNKIKANWFIKYVCVIGLKIL